MKRESADNPQEMASALAQIGASALFANKASGFALAFTNTGKGVERKFHKFTTKRPITSKNDLSRAARKELQAAGLLGAQASGASAKRLIARGRWLRLFPARCCLERAQARPWPRISGLLITVDPILLRM